MRLTTDNKFRKLIVIGDRIAIRLTRPNEKQKAVYICRPVYRKKRRYNRYGRRTGPGYAIPMPVEDEPWKMRGRQGKICTSAGKKEGVTHILLSGATEVLYEGENTISFRKVPYRCWKRRDHLTCSAGSILRKRLSSLHMRQPLIPVNNHWPVTGCFLKAGGKY